MLPGFVDRTGGSQWPSALLTADLGRSNLWRPTLVERMRGSRWLSALPAGSKWVQAQPARPTGSAGMSFSENSGKPEKLGTLIYGPQFRVLSGCSKLVQAQPAPRAMQVPHPPRIQ